MKFNQEMLAALRDGRKTQTRRPENKGYKVGESVMVRDVDGNETGERIRIKDIRYERIGNITEKEAWDEGFPNPMVRNGNHQDRAKYWFKVTWMNIYGEWNPEQWVWVYEFEVVE